MAQHFLLSRQAKTLTLAQVLRMSDAEAEATLKRIRWAATNGEPCRTASRCSALQDWRWVAKKSIDFCGYWQRHVTKDTPDRV